MFWKNDQVRRLHQRGEIFSLQNALARPVRCVWHGDSCIGKRRGFYQDVIKPVSSFIGGIFSGSPDSDNYPNGALSNSSDDKNSKRYIRETSMDEVVSVMEDYSTFESEEKFEQLFKDRWIRKDGWKGKITSEATEETWNNNIRWHVGVRSLDDKSWGSVIAFTRQDLSDFRRGDNVRAWGRLEDYSVSSISVFDAWLEHVEEAESLEEEMTPSLPKTDVDGHPGRSEQAEDSEASLVEHDPPKKYIRETSVAEVVSVMKKYYYSDSNEKFKQLYEGRWIREEGWKGRVLGDATKDDYSAKNGEFTWYMGIPNLENNALIIAYTHQDLSEFRDGDLVKVNGILKTYGAGSVSVGKAKVTLVVKDE